MKDIVDFLQNIKGSGKFVSVDTVDFVLPGLQIDNIGEISFPLTEVQAKELISFAQQAPYGKGSQTLVDTSIRNTWEIDAKQIFFKNPAWNKMLKSITNNIKTDLGLEGYAIKTELYKLLIYEKGGFFLKHKDSEKEKGMFGTLVIGLPSPHTGGELVVEFEKEIQVANFSQSDSYKMGYAAFYADCCHEVKPVTSGYRICLVYNLIQEQPGKKIILESSRKNTELFSALFNEYIRQYPKNQYIILLGHQYTPENFSFESLKLHDRFKAEILIKTAENLGYYSKLCLVTSYLSGPPSIDDYYDNDVENDIIDINEVYDSRLEIETFAINGIPPLKNVSFIKEDLISSFPLDEDEPIEKENTGYMGNYGPDIMYWYHYGAIMLWPPEANARMLISQSAATQLEWINYFNHSTHISNEEQDAVRAVILSGLPKGYEKIKLDFTPVIEWILTRNEWGLLFSMSDERIQLFFKKIDTQHWIKLLQELPENERKEILDKTTRSLSQKGYERLLEVIKSLFNDESLHYLSQIYKQEIPEFLKKLNQHSVIETSKSALQDLFWIDMHIFPSQDWAIEVKDAMFESPNRNYIHNVLVPAIFENNQPSTIVSLLKEACNKYLQTRVDNKPQPPQSWSRSVPIGSRYDEQWKKLKDFIESSTETVLDYKKIQKERDLIEMAINNETIDLRTETIRKGSPHTLRITKTQDEYLRLLKIWNEDLDLLNKIIQD